LDHFLFEVLFLSRLMNIRRYQICPNCGYQEEQGRRWERRRQVYHYFWRNDDCPQCGEKLARSCPNCQADILSPEARECPECGQTYPWVK